MNQTKAHGYLNRTMKTLNKCGSEIERCSTAGCCACCAARLTEQGGDLVYKHKPVFKFSAGSLIVFKFNKMTI